MVLQTLYRWCLFGSLALVCGAQQKPEPPTASEEPERRVELNLLGQIDTQAGESRRNENVQFNLVDNNALKELNVRLGTTATIVEEFRPERGYFGSEFGNAPSAVLRLTPSSQRSWHGNLFYSHLNSVFTARSFFQVGDVQPARENTYGFLTGLVPWKGGYLSVRAKQDKLRGSVNGNVLVPAPDERIPLATDPDRLAIVERFLAAYPAQLPNRTDINPRALNTNSPQSIDNDEAAVRVEQDLTGRDRLLLDYVFVSQSVEAFQLVSGQNPNTDTKSHSARATWNRTWDAATTSSLSFGFLRISSLLLPDETAVGSMISPAGLSTLGPLGDIPIDRAHNRFRGAGSLQRISGNHTVTAGFQILRQQFNGIETDAHRGFFSFSNDFGRSGIENLRAGTPSQHIISIGDVHRGFRNWSLGFYIGDNWRVRGNFSLQIGLRYEPVTSPYEVNGRNEIPYDCDCNNFAPRLGFAYRLPGAGGTLRGAYGLHYGEILPVTFSQVRLSPPGSQKLAIPNPDLVNPLSDLNNTRALGNLYQLDPELASQYSHQYNLSWEPALPGGWRLQLGYVGSRSHKLPIMWYLNRAQPVAGIPQATATINQRRAIDGLAEIRWVLNGSRGYFDAARVSLVRPSYRGFTIEAAYWFSKAMDLGASYTNTAYSGDSRLSRSQWEFETHRDRRALSSFDQSHAFLLRGNWEAPAARGGRWSSKLTGGWILSGVVLLKSGTPFTVGTSDGPGFGNVDGNGGDRPNLLDPSILGRSINHPDTSVARLPASVFAFMEPTDRGGNLGVNVFRKDGIANVNASVARTWKTSTATDLTFRAESINLLNTPQFAEPGSQLGTLGFATITNTLNDGRTFRFLLRFGW
ncbi:MAG: hypothetical protein GY953_07720 [bacterium]|nr:hypothetical protein [bacterium]